RYRHRQRGRDDDRGSRDNREGRWRDAEERSRVDRGYVRGDRESLRRREKTHDDGENQREKGREGSPWGRVSGRVREDLRSGEREPSEGPRESTLNEGSRVEVRYHGKGTKFYKGKIMRVNSDATFDIAYDDGDREVGIAQEHVKSLEGSGDRDRQRVGTDKFSKGDAVEAKYRGKGSKYYRGRISRVNSDGTLDIAYDDGDKEVGIEEVHVRFLEGADNRERGCEGDDRSSTLQRGDRVEARYHGRGTKFYRGKISRVNSDGTFDISYDDGEKELGLTEEHVVSLEPGATRNSEKRAGTAKLARGDRVEARYRGKGTKFYKGKISRVNSDGTFDINYDDGDKELGLAEEHVVSLEPGAGRDPEKRAGTSKLAQSDRVEARYHGRGTKFYRGKISRVNSDGTFDIKYDDGERDLGLAEEHVVSLKPEGGHDDGKGIGRSKLAKGDRVEARYRGKGTKFYKGKISRVNSDGTFDVSYDDGDKELGLAEEHVVSLEPGTSRDSDKRGGTSKLAKGDRVEARYRGKGPKFYKGKISRVNSDGTFDINYNDGEKDIELAEEHVISLEPGAGRDSDKRDGTATLAKGDRVEARYRGKGTKFYKGKISRVNSDGTFDINYDDGEKELGLAEEHVVSLEPGAGRDSEKRTGTSKLAKGDRVEARYHGRGTKFYRGKISRVNSDGTFDVSYDDGEEDIELAEEHVVSLESGAGRESEKRTGTAKLARGDRVEARYHGRGTKFYKGKISRVNSDGTFDINYEDGERELGLAEEHVVSLEPRASRDATKTNERVRGDRVEARYHGRGTKFYKGKISRVNSDGTFDVSYDDGEKDTRVLTRGDRVEARFHGRGTKFYKGKISRANSDGTFDVHYDDGEKERGLAEEHIRSLETDDPRREERRCKTLARGDPVEARYRGKGTKFFKGNITRVNSDGTIDITYDDGDKDERGVPVKNIRSLNTSASPRSSGGGASAILKGDRVEARYRGRGSKFYKGKIIRVNSDATFDIDYDDGEKELCIDAEHVRSLESARPKRGGRTSGRMPQEGDKVEANYRCRGRYYKGRIDRVNKDDTFDITYDDGEREHGVVAEMIRLSVVDRGGTVSDLRHNCGNDGRLKRGDVVEARYRGRGARFYKGVIARVNSDETFDVDYDDGEKDLGLAEEHVRSLTSNGKEGGGNRRKAEKISEGDQIESNYQGRGRYHKGRVRRIHRDGTFDIDYDDGEKERNIDAKMVRALSTNPAVFDGRSIVDKVDRGRDKKYPLRRGDSVEARYRGRGTKFYKGKISRVNSDATFDINYDDGEKDFELAEEHVRPLELHAQEEIREKRPAALREGDKIECNYRGKGRYYQGRINRSNLDGTFNIDYDDGEKERGVPEEMIISLSADHVGGGRGGGKLKKGDAVEARYRARGTKFYRGRIVRVNSDATFDIDYDDGDKERGIAEEHVRSLESSEVAFDERNSGRARPAASFHRGDKVEARYRGKGSKFFAGKIARVNSDATFDIAYDDGDKDTGLVAEHIRSSEPASPRSGRKVSNAGSELQLEVGDRVEGNYRGRGRYYKGRINSVHSDGTFDIDYDDGEKERGLSRRMIRTSDNTGDRVSDVARSRDRNQRNPLQRGDEVEARYRGRGTKFYKGRIVRVNSDGTFDIAYDDGEKEISIAREHVRILGSPSTTTNDRRDSTPAAVLAEGDRIEGNYRGKGRYYKGHISRCNLDGTFNIDYDDGEKERGVACDMIRLFNGR
ncbi:unnamed protein product, partial [Sphacelaria rigidula]